jgi:hypothetical protein
MSHLFNLFFRAVLTLGGSIHNSIAMGSICVDLLSAAYSEGSVVLIIGDSFS